MAAKPASAQQGQWAAARQQRRAMMRARRQAAARAYGAQGHSQANPPAQHANGEASASAHPTATSTSANSGGPRPNEPRPNETRPNASGAAENSRGEGAGSAANAQANS